MNTLLLQLLQLWVTNNVNVWGIEYVHVYTYTSGAHHQTVGAVVQR